jgi:GNAT superfamily N-acetyltransferase
MIEYKQTQKEKLPEIVVLNHEIFLGMYSRDPYILSEYENRLSSASPVVFTAEENEKIIGDSVAFEKDGAWYLWILGVHANYRKQGIANHLFEMNEMYAKTHGFKKVIIKIYSVSSAMIELAKKRGYLITKTEKENEETFIVVELVL